MPIKLYFYKEDTEFDKEAEPPMERYIPIDEANSISLYAASITTERAGTAIEIPIRDVQQIGRKPIVIPMGYSGTNIQLQGFITDETTAQFLMNTRPGMLVGVKRCDYHDGTNYLQISTYHEMFPGTDADYWWEIHGWELSREQGQTKFWNYTLNLTQQHYKEAGYR